MDWINDGTHFCIECETTFRVFAKDSEPYINFCPVCASRNIECAELEDEDD